VEEGEGKGKERGRGGKGREGPVKSVKPGARKVDSPPELCHAVLFRPH